MYMHSAHFNMEYRWTPKYCTHTVHVHVAIPTCLDCELLERSEVGFRPRLFVGAAEHIYIHIHVSVTLCYVVVAVRSLHSMSAASVNAVKASRCNYFVGSY